MRQRCVQMTVSATNETLHSARGSTLRSTKPLSHSATQPLPSWVAEYLQGVAAKILGDLGPHGSLSPASAHAALRLVGEQWPQHHPESVYSIIRAWIDAGRVDGRKAGAVRYIEEYMGNDRNVPPKKVIEWYRKGQKAERQASLDSLTAEEENLVAFDHAIRPINPQDG